MTQNPLRSLPIAHLDSSLNDRMARELSALFSSRTDIHREEKPKTRRSTLNCGWDYTKLKAGERVWREPPEVFHALYAEVRARLQQENVGLVLPPAFTNGIASLYSAGDRLTPHIDVNQRQAREKKLSAFFGEQIVGVVLKADQTGHLFFVDGPNQIDLEESDGLCFVMQGDFRHQKPHGITPVSEDGRLSVTFRTMEFEAPC